MPRGLHRGRDLHRSRFSRRTFSGTEDPGCFERLVSAGDDPQPQKPVDLPVVLGPLAFLLYA
jgi:hypothetical protein